MKYLRGMCEHGRWEAHWEHEWAPRIVMGVEGRSNNGVWCKGGEFLADALDTQGWTADDLRHLADLEPWRPGPHGSLVMAALAFAAVLDALGGKPE